MSIHASKSIGFGYVLTQDMQQEKDDQNLYAPVFGKGLQPFLDATGQPMPPSSSRDFIQTVADYVRANKAPQQKWEMWQIVPTSHKTVSLLVDVQEPARRKELIDGITAIVAKHLGKVCENHLIRSGPQGVHKEAAASFMGVIPNTHDSRGNSHLHHHGWMPNMSWAASGRYGAPGNLRARLFDQLALTNAYIQKDIGELLLSKNIPVGLSKDGKHVVVLGLEKVADTLSFGKADIDKYLKDADRAGDPQARAFAALAVHAANKRDPDRKNSTSAERQLVIRLECEKQGVNLFKYLVREFPHPSTVAAQQQPQTAKEKAEHLRQMKHAAYLAVDEGIKNVDRKYGVATKEQVLEECVLASIGKTVANGQPLNPKHVEGFAKLAMKDEKYFGLRMQIYDDQVRYVTEGMPKRMEKAFADKAVETEVQETEKGKKSLLLKAKEMTLGVATAVLAKVTTPKTPPGKIELTTDKVNDFVREHERKSRRSSLLHAVRDGSTRPAHDLQALAQNIRRSYWEQRNQHERLPKGTVIVVKDSNLLDAANLEALQKLVKRDKAVLQLEGRDGPVPTPDKDQSKAAKQQQTKQPELTKHQFLGQDRQ